MSVRVEFRLTMPGRGSWDGGWSGDVHNFLCTKVMSPTAAVRLMRGQKRRTWTHRWSDGWSAQITARVLEPRERRAKTGGFSGYGWMVDNILRYDATEKPDAAT
jgi:hypothetical protein